MMKNEVTSEQASVLEKNKQVMQQFIRFINTGDRSIGETIIAPEVIFYAPPLRQSRCTALKATWMCYA
ncbi:hypothetical protein [Phocaeicola plebeius]|jgi:hypothetical protein|uniref:hypothetical protein n=1 Tax=Phocaeicola plebeius TaxID=310297 RepID=UPI003AB74074